MATTLLASYLDGVANRTPAVHSRALAYGDGIFETMRTVAGKIPLWHWHAQRIASSLARLGLQTPDLLALADELKSYANQFPNHIIKLMLIAGAIGRGYGRSSDQVHRLVLIFPAPTTRRYLRVGISDVRLALQPLLAGIKHLNRLEQVLAAQRKPAELDEVLQLSADGALVCASSANIILQLDGQLFTPDLSQCGVAGVMRAALMQKLSVQVARLTMDQAMAAEAIYLTNAVRGVEAITDLAGKNLQLHSNQLPVYIRQTLDDLAFAYDQDFHET